MKFTPIIICIVFLLSLAYSSNSCISLLNDIENCQNLQCVKQFAQSQQKYLQCLPLIAEKFNGQFKKEIQLKQQQTSFEINVQANQWESSQVKQQIQEINLQSENVQHLAIKLHQINRYNQYYYVAPTQYLDFSSIQSLPNLQSFTLQIIGMPDQYEERKSQLQVYVTGLEFLMQSQELQTLVLNVSCNLRNFGNISQIIQNISSLQYIKMNFDKFKLGSIDFSNNVNLNSLFINTEYVDQQANFKFEELQKLKHFAFQVQYASQYTSILQQLKGSRNLQSIKLSYYYCNLISADFLEDLSSFQQLNTIDLDLRYNDIFDFQPLATGIFPLKHLQNLDINLYYNPRSDQTYGIPNIKNIFDQHYKNSLKDYYFKV